MSEEFKEEEEYVPLHIPEEFRKIEAELEQWTVRDIWSRLLTGEIDYEPAFQRHYVWDDVKASRFIESLLLGIPVPAIFIAEETDGKWVVVDGHQRLETILRFLQPLLTKTQSDRDIFTKTAQPTKVERKGARRYIALTLKQLEVLVELNRKIASQIEEKLIKDFWERRIPVVKIPKTVHPDLKYAIFLRLNQGSVTLNHQEIRNCLYRGPYNDLIRDLGEDPKFLKLWKKREPDRRMKDRERVLAFFAFAHLASLEEYEPPRHRFLNHEMEINRDASKETLEDYKREFWTSTDWVKRVFGEENAFRLFEAGNEENPQGKWIRKMDTIYEVEMVGFKKFGGRLEELLKDLKGTERDLFIHGLKHKLVGLMTVPRFKTTLLEGTARPFNVRTRFEMWNRTIEEALANPQAVIANTKLILDLWRKSTACWLCTNSINSFEDAVLTEENGEYHLVHRCHSGGALE